MFDKAIEKLRDERAGNSHDVSESAVERVVNCSCGGLANTRKGALFGYYVVCKGCGKSTKIGRTEQDVISSWNFYVYGS